MQRAVDLIESKRHGRELSAEQIRWLVDGYLGDTVSDGQMAAFLMAGVLRGFTEGEAVALTRTMVESGEVLDLSALSGPTIDKHSTGGVADGTTFLVAPLLAAAGAQVVKLSGRGLGHTGGTLDKLESVPGCRVHLEPGEVLDIAERVGCVVAAQTSELVPADRALYALRDETATVDSAALVASSVMSKKIAAGARTIVLDVKAGEGAFMTELDQARGLAELCVRIGTEAGRRTMALVTDMNQPLGGAVGNALEIVEAVELLSGEPHGRLAQVALELAAVALSEARNLTGKGGDLAGTRRELAKLWSDGKALERLELMIVAQGGDPQVCEMPRKILPRAPVIREVPTTEAGVCTAVPAREIGRLGAQLGAGRIRKGEDVDPAVGIEILVEVGDERDAGDLIARVHAKSHEDAEAAVQRLRELISLGEGAERIDPILHRIVSG
jgi:pyrimidine-nucleoside phosphorylase